MKKKQRYSLLVVALFIFLFWNPISINADTVDSTEKKLLFESDFESTDFDSWSAFGNHSKLFIDSTHSHSGRLSLGCTERTASWSGPALNITGLIAPEHELYFEGYAICEKGNSGNISLSIKLTDNAGNDTYEAIDSKNVGENIWESFNGSIAIPENTIDAVLYFESTDELIGFSIDDVKIYGCNIHPSASIKNGSDNEHEYSFSFEDDIDGWMPRGALSLETTDQFSFKGKKSLYASNREYVWNVPSVRVDKVKAGANYEYSAYVMYNGKEYEDKHIFTINLQYTLNGEEEYVVVDEKELQKGSWSKISGKYTLPDGATNIYLFVQTEYVDINECDENDLMSFYVDDVKISDATLINSRELIMKIVFVISAVLILGVCFLVVFSIVRKSRRRKSILREANFDAMTKTYNRNTFEKHIMEYQASSEKCKNEYIIVCDVNYLKYINDNYGHEDGDKAIIRCASVLLKVIGKKGKVYRTGGDEFVCITSECVTERLKDELTLEASKYEGYPFSIAVGEAHYDEKIDSADPDIMAVMSRADIEMYKNKEEIKAAMKDFTGK